MKKVAIEGDLSYFSIVEIYYLLSRFEKTGRLIIKRKGNIYISEGKVIHAETDSSEGIDAFFALSMIKEGRFNFQPDERASINTISQPLSELIETIEAREDELNVYRKDLPPLATIPEKSSKAPEGEKVALKKDDWKILILSDGRRTLKEIIEASPLDALNTYKTLSWLFKEGLLYDPEEKIRIVDEGVKKASGFLRIFGDGPWRRAAVELISESGLEDAISIAGNDFLLLQKNFPLDLEKTKEFFDKLVGTLKSKAEETLGKLLVNKRMKEIDES